MVTDHLSRNGHSVGVNTKRYSRLRSVCVIGSGAAGLCALRHFSSKPDCFDRIVCYEQSDRVGGTWNYTEQTGLDQHGLPILSSMYRDLHTNVPIQIMEFPDFPTKCTESYVHHSEIRDYLRDYANNFNLERLIQFRHHLKHLTRDHENNCWRVMVQDLIGNQTYTEHFDIVILCPGRYSIPNWPNVKNLNAFNGHMIHSHDYRSREEYAGQRVAVVGGGPSGIDICLEISKVADEVLFVNHTKHFPSLPVNVHQINSSLYGFKTNSVLIKNHDTEKILEYSIDSVIMATGYRLNLNYLDQDSCALRLNSDDTIDGLYRHMINIQYPSMILMGICNGTILPFPLYHQQMKYYLSLQTGAIMMPSKEQMIFEINQEIIEQQIDQNWKPRLRHNFNVDKLFKYFKQLELDANLKPLIPVKLRLFRKIEQQIRSANIVTYKRVNYRFIDDENYEETN